MENWIRLPPRSRCSALLRCPWPLDGGISRDAIRLHAEWPVIRFASRVDRGRRFNLSDCTSVWVRVAGVSGPVCLPVPEHHCRRISLSSRLLPPGRACSSHNRGLFPEARKLQAFLFSNGRSCPAFVYRERLNLIFDGADPAVACCRFCGPREKVLHEAGGIRWRGVSSVGSARSRWCVWYDAAFHRAGKPGS